MAEPNTAPQKRHYQDEKGRYVLPNDAPEHDRLDTQSKGLISVMHNKPFHAPVTAPRRILDIGCGTGAMTYLLAKRFPDAQVIGLDISPVPERYEKVANLTYVQGDIMDIAGRDERFREGGFDYVFHRLLVLGMTDWPGYVRKVSGLLAPGGWAEMQDYEMAVYSASGRNVSAEWWHQVFFIEDCSTHGLDTEVGRKLAGFMRDVGLQAVEEQVYRVPCFALDDLPEAQKPIAELMQGMVQFKGHQRSLMERISAGRRSAEVLERMVAGAEQAGGAFRGGEHSRFFVAVGRKAA